MILISKKKSDYFFLVENSGFHVFQILGIDQADAFISEGNMDSNYVCLGEELLPR